MLTGYISGQIDLSISGSYMNRVIFLVVLSLAIASPVLTARAADRPTNKYDKGAELYSWEDPAGVWFFALLPGTDLFKPDALIKKKENQLTGVNALEKRFMSLAEGEWVTWVGRKGFPLPGRKTVEEVMSVAKKAKVDLHVPSMPNRKG